MEKYTLLKEEYLKLEEAFLKVEAKENLAGFRDYITALAFSMWEAEPCCIAEYGEALGVIYGGAAPSEEELTKLQAIGKKGDLKVLDAYGKMPAEDGKKFVNDLLTFLTDLSFVNGDCTADEANAIARISALYDGDYVSETKKTSDLSIFDLSNKLHLGSAPKAKKDFSKMGTNELIEETMGAIEKMVKSGLTGFGDLRMPEVPKPSVPKEEIKTPEAEKKSEEQAPEKTEEKSEEKAVENADAKKEEKPEKTLEELMEELDNLVGLETVKKDIKAMINFIKVCQLRKERNLKAPELSHHMVFSGNPGTGKTTIARLLSKVYKQIGLLEKGQLVEVDRSGLIAGYQGQTALKTAEVIQSALGGVLFIDEAYSLVQADNDSYGKECIATVLKAMEDHRDELVVIVAGYDDLMQKFIDSNPGLKSRFNKYIHFPDYTGEEMEKIFLLQCKSNGYIIEEAAQKLIRDVFDRMFAMRDDNFGNGRTVRNTFEKIINCQATRLADAKSEGLTDEELMKITLADVKAGLEMDL